MRSDEARDLEERAPGSQSDTVVETEKIPATFIRFVIYSGYKICFVIYSVYKICFVIYSVYKIFLLIISYSYIV